MSRLDFTPYRRSTVGFDRLFDLLESQARSQSGDNYPPFNIARSGEDNYRITLAVAGFRPADIDITAQQNLLTVQGTIQLALGIQVAAALPSVGLGVQPPVPSLGRMLADAQTLVTIAPHLAIFPGLAIILIVVGLNLLGDGLRDWLDPRLKVARA